MSRLRRGPHTRFDPAAARGGKRHPGERARGRRRGRRCRRRMPPTGVPRAGLPAMCRHAQARRRFLRRSSPQSPDRRRHASARALRCDARGRLLAHGLLRIPLLPARRRAAQADRGRQPRADPRRLPARPEGRTTLHRGARRSCRRAGNQLAALSMSGSIQAWSTIASAFLASSVEAVEALTVVLAVGVVRGWPSALLGTSAAVGVLVVVVAVFGVALASIPIALLQIVVGSLLLLFGLRWLRKAMLRARSEE